MCVGPGKTLKMHLEAFCAEEVQVRKRNPKTRTVLSLKLLQEILELEALLASEHTCMSGPVSAFRLCRLVLLAAVMTSIMASWLKHAS